jgi:HAMP domain-containing protein
MSSHVIEIGRRRFVCGLFWQSLSRPRELRKEAVDLASRMEFDLLVLRRDHGVAQAGYAHSDDGVQPGMLSLGAAVASGVAVRGAVFAEDRHAPHSWLGAFELPDGKWAYFAVRDDGFLPNGDFCGTKEEVQERLLADYGLGGWNVVIGEASLEAHGFHNYVHATLEQLLHVRLGRARVNRHWKLSSVRRRVRWKPMVIGALVLATLAAAAVVMFARQRDAERARLLEQARQQLAAKQAAVAPPHPWPDQPLPADYVRSCVEHLGHYAPGGWQLEEYACSGRQATHAWSRGTSTVTHLLKEMPQAVVDLAGDKATFRIELEAGRSQDERLLLAKDVLVPLMGQLQDMGLATTVTPAQAPAAAASTPGVARPDWQTFNFSVKSAGVPPHELAEVLGRPGVRLNKLSYRSGEWSIEGVIHAK